MVKDVIEGLKLVRDGIDRIKTIADAIRSGKDYVSAMHPDVRGDLRLLLDELKKNPFLIKRASAVLTNFRFAVSTDNQGLELARFNNYFIQSKTEEQHLQDHINDLRTHCHKIREHGERIGGAATPEGFTKIFASHSWASIRRKGRSSLASNCADWPVMMVRSRRVPKKCASVLSPH